MGRTERISIWIAALLVLMTVPRPTSAQETSGPAMLTTSTAIEDAVERNHGLRIRREQTVIDRRNVTVGNAGFLPRLDAIAGQDHVFGSTGLFGQDQVSTNTRIGLRLQWTVFQGLRRLATLRRLRSVRSVSELRVEAEVEATMLEVATSYWEVVLQRRILEALRETATISEERVEIERARLEAGTGTKVAVNRALVERNLDRAALAQQEVALTRAKTALNRVRSEAPDREFSVADDLPALRTLNYENLRRDALANNRPLRVRKLERSVREFAVSEVRSDRWPTLDVEMRYNYNAFHDGLVPAFETAPALEYGVLLTIPLFQGLNVPRRVDNATSEVLIADEAIQQEQDRLLADLRNTWSSYERQREQIELAEESVDLARDNVEIALVQLESGTTSQDAFRRVQENLLEAQIRLIEARFAAKADELQLLRFSGRLLDNWRLAAPSPASPGDTSGT